MAEEPHQLPLYWLVTGTYVAERSGNFSKTITTTTMFAHRHELIARRFCEAMRKVGWQSSIREICENWIATDDVDVVKWVISPTDKRTEKDLVITTD